MRIEFGGRELAREGDGRTDFIEISPPVRSASSDSIKLIGSGRFPVAGDPAEYSVSATVAYSFDSYDSANAFIYELAGILDALREGAFSAASEKYSYSLDMATCGAEFPAEILGCYFEIKFTFKGRRPQCVKIG